MKKFILLLAISLTSLAASAQNNAKATSESLKSAKTSGIYSFVLSNDVTSAQVERAATYYTNYFTTNFSADKHEVKLTLTENADINKRVIQRFFSTLSVTEVIVDGKSQPFEKVYEAYMK